MTGFAQNLISEVRTLQYGTESRLTVEHLFGSEFKLQLALEKKQPEG
jgi:hypothetical protein